MENRTKKENGNHLSIRLSELMYLCFFSLMLFAKGIGLYDGQLLYKLCLVAAFLCLGVKMCITGHRLKEWGIILGVLAFCVLIYRHSGEKGILICTVTVLAMKNVAMERVFRVGLLVWSIAWGGRFFLSLLNLENVQMAVQTKSLTGGVLRYFMGFPHPNVLHISYFVLAAFVVYGLKDNYRLRHLCALLWGNLFLFFYSYSLTGAIAVGVYLFLSYYVVKKKISKVEYVLAELAFPLCLLVSIALPVLATGRIFALADKIFNNRVAFSKHFLTWDNISLVGNNLASITTDIVTMDNSFVFALIIYGILAFAAICILYAMLIHTYVKERKNIELAMIICFFLAGITEPFLFNTSFKNLTLLFLGEYLWISGEDKKNIFLLKHADKELVFPTTGVRKAGAKVMKVWGEYHKRIVYSSAVIATLLTLLGILTYQAPQYVLAVEVDRLLLFERIRVAMTIWTISYASLCLIGCLIGYCGKRRECMSNGGEN